MRSRFIKYPFEKLNHAMAVDFSPPPPCDIKAIGSEMEMFISAIGPDLCRFQSDPDRVKDCADLLGKLMGRLPQREERLAAATLDMTLQVYHTYTNLDLRPIVEWHSDVWVHQESSVLEQQINTDDCLGNFIRDVWTLRRVDPIAAANSLVWAHVYRTKFIAGTDYPYLLGDKYHALALRPLLVMVERNLGHKYKEYELRDAIRKSYIDNEPGNDYPRRPLVNMLSLNKKCITDHYRDNGGELPCESVLKEYLSATPLSCMLIHASVVDEKLCDNTGSTPPRGLTFVDEFMHMISAPGYYPFERPEEDWLITPEDVRAVVEECKHTRGLGVEDLAPPPEFYVPETPPPESPPPESPIKRSRPSTTDSRRSLFCEESPPYPSPPSYHSSTKSTTKSPPITSPVKGSQSSYDEDPLAKFMEQLPSSPLCTPPDPFPKSVSSQPYDRS